ncbi:hypothetical protein ACFLRA_01210 [Bdellovibrionota bacterium]
MMKQLVNVWIPILLIVVGAITLVYLNAEREPASEECRIETSECD